MTALVLLTAIYIAAHRFWTTVRTPAAVIPGEITSWKLEVVNASGLPGVAQRITDLLRREGFDVVDIRTQRTPIVERTLILDRAGHPQSAGEIAKALGLPADRVQVQLDRTLLLDVTVLVGKDHTQFAPMAGSGR